ncbi:phosphatase PAP2 family protein [Streptomyces turgidiscabies]|uniref:PAP2 family protein n=1 Tax=Streptomyces turgidiscabies (strain Car8) TaxID=698760 RepID=L7EWR0_STRT8|nr:MULTISPECIES: phosphatase PAP2 family protein [Streptomyces]ELP63111.1 PAP2 family protein [Streptomyces turgidiscabies Car8]MDX3493593.1 phosphatase PAP2 family protein [Streptomyces turgidiscabies]
MRTEGNLARLDRVFARLDREPGRPTHIDVPKMSRHRIALLVATLVFYLATVWAVVITSWLVRLDWQVMFFRPYQQWPEIHAFLDYYVVLGQRGPTAVMISAWLGWRAWRQHTLRPLLTFGAALLLLNITVGAAKIGMGRLGPHYATTIGSNEMGMGGDIFPSGHTANAVVTWGILAYLASTPRARRWLSASSALMSLGVGLTTVYLGTHWLSDVVLGWVAGLLVLLALPWCEPMITRAETWILEQRDRRRVRGASPAPVPARVGTPAMRTPHATAGQEATARENTAPAAHLSRPPAHPAHPAPHPHASRSERTPVTPAGSRRPPHADRAPRATGNPSTRPLPGNS